MTRGADGLPVSDHAVLRYLQRVLNVDVDAVRRLIHEETAAARTHGARGTTVNGVVYRLREGYVASCFIGEPIAVQIQHRTAVKKILRNARKVPILQED
jgi:hypothetical protein